MASEDERFMARALELARKATRTAPNPRVGAVLVRDGVIVAEGYHRGPGTPHAEMDALRGTDARGTTLYVNLEPCSHTGRTPPCAPALAAAGVKRVVASLVDPDERVSGRGFGLLQSQGVDVEVGVLAAQARLLNTAFLHHARFGCPLVSLKLALSLDGRLAAVDGSSKWITGEASRAEVHRRRRDADAILVGSGTIAADDPSLTVRELETETQPVKIVADTRGRTSPDARVLSEGKTIMATTPAIDSRARAAYERKGAEVVVLPERDGGVDFRALVEAMAQRGWTEIYCEGGSRVAASLIRDDLVGRIDVFYGPIFLGDGPTLQDLGVASIGQARRYATAAVDRIGDDVVVTLLKDPV